MGRLNLSLGPLPDTIAKTTESVKSESELEEVTKTSPSSFWVLPERFSELEQPRRQVRPLLLP